MVNVEQGALRAFEQDRLAALERLVQQQSRVRDAVGEAVGKAQDLIGNRFGLEGLAVVDLREDLVLDLQCGLDFLGEELLVENIGGDLTTARSRRDEMLAAFDAGKPIPYLSTK